jgi:hypothetical protein
MIPCDCIRIPDVRFFSQKSLNGTENSEIMKKRFHSAFTKNAEFSAYAVSLETERKPE